MWTIAKVDGSRAVAFMVWCSYVTCSTLNSYQGLRSIIYLSTFVADSEQYMVQ